MIKFTVFIALIVKIYAQDGCIINITELDQEPIVFDQFYSFLYPSQFNDEEDNDITVPFGQTIIITCPGGHLDTDQGQESSTILATCNQDSQLVYDDKILNFSSLSCSNIRPETVRVTEQTCANNSKIIIVGFEVGLNIDFVPLITVCFDLVARNPLWAEHHLSRYSASDHIGIIVELVDETIYNLNVTYVDLFFSIDYPRRVINNLVGLYESSDKYVKDGMLIQHIPLNWGHNFIYKTQVNASAHLVNSGPQWPLFDSPTNWDITEDSVLAFARENKLELDIFTGTYGISTLPHEETGEDVDIYLYTDDSIKAIPMPELYWKLIFDPITRRATAFVTLNNPFQTDFTKSILCTDISAAIPWLSWREKDDSAHGYSYACTYHELREAISYLPDLDVVGILV